MCFADMPLYIFQPDYKPHYGPTGELEIFFDAEKGVLSSNEEK